MDMGESSVLPGSTDPGTILEPHRGALRLHCYRMTGSFHDAEDLVQETFLRAWQKYGSFKGASSVRTWLYRIATNVCLDALKRRRAPRRLRPNGRASDPRLPVGSPTDEADWLQPYPDSGLADTSEGPEENLLIRERISLAFCAALQLLPPRQRAVLILTDVLDWRTAEAAEALGMSVPAAESALHRARVTLAAQRQPGHQQLASDAGGVQALLDRYLKAWEADDVDDLVALLRDGASLTMPPFPSWYQGREAVRTILSLHPFGLGRRAGWRLSPTRANGQPAFALYRADEAGGPFRAFGLMVLSVAESPEGPSVSALTIYKDPGLVLRFSLPPETSRAG